MELAERYIYTVYETKSFSKAARKLYITQSSLSATVKKHENKLGFLVFDRSKSPIELTQEGKIFIDYLEEINQNENTMKERIRSISNPHYEHLAIGGTSFFSHHILPKACKRFHSLYPNIRIQLDIGEANYASTMFDRLDTGQLQLVIGFDIDKPKYTCVTLADERYMVAIRKDLLKDERLLPYALTRKEVLFSKIPNEKIITDYSLFENTEFLKIKSTGILWQDMSKFLAQCPSSPCYITNCRNIDYIYNMMLLGLGAAPTTDTVVKAHPKCKDVCYFVVKLAKPSRRAMVVYRNDIPLPKGAKDFIDVLQQFV